MNDEPVRAVAYLRVSAGSSDDVRRRRDGRADDPSIEQQRKALREYAAAHNIEIVRWYIDEDRPASDPRAAADRPAFQRMVTDAKERGDFDAVLVRSQDRFSRLDPADFFTAAQPFIAAGVQLITVDEGPKDWLTAIGQVMMSVSQLGKSDYAKAMAFNIAGGMLQTVAEFGGWPGGRVYGYDARPVPEPRAKRGSIAKLFPDDKAPVVRELFERYAGGGWGLKTLAVSLNARGVPSPNGGPWCASTIRRILTNEVYLGHTLYNRNSLAVHAVIRAGGAERLGPADKAERRRRFDRRRRRNKEGAKILVVPNDPADVIRKENTHEAIVTPELFAAVQARLKSKRHRTEKNAKRGYVLAGVLYCGHCGYSMQGKKSHTAGGRPRLQYTCYGFHTQGPTTCRYRAAYEDDVLSAVGDLIWDELMGDAGKAWEARLRESLHERNENAPKDAERLRNEMAALERNVKKARGNLALLDADMIPDVTRQIREWEARHKTLAGRLAEVERHAKRVTNIEGRVKEARERMCAIGHMFREGQREFDRRLLAEEVERVELGWAEEEVTTPKRGTYVRSRLASVTVVFKPESLLGAEALAVFLEPYYANIAGESQAVKPSTVRIL
jgi:site-specific DNA recombinase